MSRAAGFHHRIRAAVLLSLGAALLLVLGAAAFPSFAREGAAATTGGTGAGRAYWVFFTDRGGTPLTPADLAGLAEAIPPEAWARRTRNGDRLPDVHDAPLWRPYVEEVSKVGRIRHQSRWLNAVSAVLTAGGVARARALPFVCEVRPVAVGRPQGLGPAFGPDGRPLERTLPLREIPPAGIAPYGPAYGQLQEIGVPSVLAQGYSANRVRMMMLDTGFRKDHHAFAHAHILAEWDFVFHDGDVQNQPNDDPDAQTHGTGTWAVAGGYDPNHIVGPAYGASFVLAKTEDIRSETEVEEDNYVAALEWADSLGVSVTSASLSYTCFDDGFCYESPMFDGHHSPISIAIEVAAERGILCVNAAGNYGPYPRSLGTPADADSMLAVGAVDSLNIIAYFSSRGPTDDGRIKPEVVARGESTWWADASGTDTYGYADGTSLSTPLVGGSCALLFEVHPEWSNMQARQALMSTADRHTAPGDDYGWGRINVAAAMLTSPVLYPFPFSLIAPADSSTVSTFAPTFSWHRSRPAVPGTVQYELDLRDVGVAGNHWVLSAGADTVYTLGFALAPSRVYAWEVHAVGTGGYRRFSRESFTFHTPGISGPIEAHVLPRELALRLSSNPFAGGIRFRVDSASAGSEGISWAVYDPIGRRLASASSSPGVFSGSWDGHDAAGASAPAGIYYLEVRCGAEFARRTLVRLASSGSARR